MALPIHIPFLPMEALSADEIPAGSQWQYEPKWDGFRCVAFREGGKVELQSKAGKLLTRYFPEVVTELLAMDAEEFVLDGELCVPDGDESFSFDALLQRVHPASSRIKKLSAETPALLIVFDLLVGEGGVTIVDEPLSERRVLLEAFAKDHFPAGGRIALSPMTLDPAGAQEWLRQTGATLDGIIAKQTGIAYAAGQRTGMVKVKNYRSADCVVGGFRYAAGKDSVGSLLLGLYDDKRLLHHVGFTSALKRAEAPALTGRLLPFVKSPGFTGRAPGGPSRWASEKSAEWVPLEPHFVVEVCYDHFSGDRFRHGTSLHRWRPDKAPSQCGMDQVQQKASHVARLLRLHG